ncbi:anthranilate synthase component I family protein [Halocola ammonii]
MKFSFWPALKSKRWEKVMLLNSNSQDNRWMLALGEKRSVTLTADDQPFEKLEAFQKEKKSWLFGHLSYDLKNAVEDLSTKAASPLEFPDLHFFEPEIVVEHRDGELNFHTGKIHRTEIEELLQSTFNFEKEGEVILRNRISRKEYIESINRILKHIQLGDVYEMNFCQEFFAENVKIDPATVYHRLNGFSEAPFSAFYKLDDQFLISASPERFLKKEKNKIISQPIKGTTKRGKDEAEDSELREQLQNDPKERAENVMITDLVRNDLSRFAGKGSVKVDELCGIHSFKTVHQMISTVSCEVSEKVGLAKILRSTFPMGSMTGAPKVSSMQLIERYENMKRGLYSGSVGYITPDGDFDFNVVIRSLQFNSANHYLSAMVGGAITSGSIPEKEYEECLLKAEALRKALVLS